MDRRTKYNIKSTGSPYGWAELGPRAEDVPVRPLRQKMPGKMLFLDSADQVFVWREGRLRYYCSLYSDDR